MALHENSALSAPVSLRWYFVRIEVFLGPPSGVDARVDLRNRVLWSHLGGGIGGEVVPK